MEHALVEPNLLIFYSFSKKQYLHPQLVFTQLINKDKSTSPPMADGHGRVVFGLI